MRKNAIARIVIYSLVVVVLVGVLTYGIKPSRDFNLPIWHFGDSDTQYDDSDYNVYSGQAEVIDTSNIQKVIVDWTSGAVNVNTSSKSTTTISEESSTQNTEKSKMRYKYDTATGVLSIHHASSGFSSKKNIKKELTLSLPKDTSLSSIEINTMSGSINLDGVTAVNSELNTASGAVNIKDTNVESMDCDVVSGHIKTLNTTLNEFDCDLTSGTLDFYGSINSSADIDTISGDVQVTTSVCPRELNVDSVSASVKLFIPKESGFTADVESISGSLSSDFDVTKSDDTYYCGDKSAKFSLESVSGKVSVNPIK